MAIGSCFCGNIKIELSGEPVTTAICHCNDCRKLTGSLYTNNIIIKDPNVKITGSPKPIRKVADSGKVYDNYFCPDCGSTLYGRQEGSDTVNIRSGIFDDADALIQSAPAFEIYAARRPGWMAPAEGAQQVEGMLGGSSE